MMLNHALLVSVICVVFPHLLAIEGRHKGSNTPSFLRGLVVNEERMMLVGIFLGWQSVLSVSFSALTLLVR